MNGRGLASAGGMVFFGRKSKSELNNRASFAGWAIRQGGDMFIVAWNWSRGRQPADSTFFGETISASSIGEFAEKERGIRVRGLHFAVGDHLFLFVFDRPSGGLIARVGYTGGCSGIGDTLTVVGGLSLALYEGWDLGGQAVSKTDLYLPGDGDAPVAAAVRRIVASQANQES